MEFLLKAMPSGNVHRPTGSGRAPPTRHMRSADRILGRLEQIQLTGVPTTTSTTADHQPAPARPSAPSVGLGGTEPGTSRSDHRHGRHRRPDERVEQMGVQQIFDALDSVESDAPLELAASVAREASPQRQLLEGAGWEASTSRADPARAKPADTYGAWLKRDTQPLLGKDARQGGKGEKDGHELSLSARFKASNARKAAREARAAAAKAVAEEARERYGPTRRERAEAKRRADVRTRESNLRSARSMRALPCLRGPGG